jgi:hypothetical protein
MILRLQVRPKVLFAQPLCRLFSSLISMLGAKGIRCDCNTFLLPTALVAREYACIGAAPLCAGPQKRTPEVSNDQQSTASWER